MKLWIGGEIEASVGDDFRVARGSVERAINAAIGNQNYSLPLASWDCIVILRDDDKFEEVTQYSKKKQDMDFRLKVSYQQFKAGPQPQREKLIYEMLERSLTILKDKGLPSEGIDHIHEDIKQVAQQHSWV